MSSLVLHREELWAVSNSGRGALPSIIGLTEAETGEKGHEHSSSPWLLATAPARRFSYSISIFISYFICKKLNSQAPMAFTSLVFKR